MENVILGIVLLLVVLFAISYIVKEKKKGTGCIGCPNAAKCKGNCSGHSTGMFR